MRLVYMNQEQRIEWLKERKTYIGGSDIGCILGLSRFNSPLDIFLDKTTDRIDESMSEAAYWGRMFEDIVAKEYAKRTCFEIDRPDGLIRHKEHSFIAANIDRWVNGKQHILECKTSHFLQGNEWGEEGTDEIPELHKCQVAYYSAICNVEKVDIAVLIGGQSFRMYTYHKDREFEDKLIRAACLFWNNHVLKGIAPSASNLEDIASLYPESDGSTIKADEQILQDVEALKAIKNEEKFLIENKISLEIKIKSCIGNHDALVNGAGEVIATWRNVKPRQVLDTKKLQEEHQDIYQQYLSEKEAGRMFLVK